MMETRNIFSTLSDGRFEGDMIDNPAPIFSPIKKAVRAVLSEVERREKERESKRKYYKTHPEQRRVESHNRRARIREAGGKLTSKECEEIFMKYGKKCLKCGSEENITLDHVVPLVLGGANSTDNLQPLCMMCNSSKGAGIADYR